MAKPRIFISYSSKDRVQAEAIHKNLEAVGDVWRDQTRLETDWSREIAFALAKSDILCLLWSANAATSRWVKHEWLTARALEKLIIPCFLPEAPDLPEPLRNVHGVAFSAMQAGRSALNKRISEALLWLKAIFSASSGFLPEAMQAGCGALNKRISEAEGFLVHYDYTMLPRNSYIPFNPNPHFKGRHADLLELYLKMIGNLNKIGINQVGTIGMGGIGKTQLAVEFAHRFSYGFHAVYWIQAASPDAWLNEFTSITTARLRREVEDFDKLEGDKAHLFALQEYFKDHPNTLVVTDNVAEPKLLNSDAYLFGLTPLTLGCDLLFTTRRDFQLPGVARQAVNVLSAEAAYELLAAYRVPKSPEDEGHVRAICSSVGFLPLAVILVGAYLNKYASDISFADYHEELVNEKKLDVIDIGKMSKEDIATRHEAAIKATLEDQWKMLEDENARQLFLLAGQFPEAAIIPKARLGLLAGIAPGRSKIDQPVPKAFSLLHDLCLIERLEDDTRAARLHPLVREFSHHLIPPADRAVFRAAAAEKLRKVLFDYARLEAEVRSQGVEAVIGDLETGIEWWGKHAERLNELKILQGALRLSAHVLVHDPYQLPGQLRGRLLGSEKPEIQRLVTMAGEWRESPWLCPIRPNLTPPGGPLVRTLEGHTGLVTAVAVTPDGRRAVSASRDQTLRIWDLESGESLRTLEGHIDEVTAVAVTPDGRRAVSASDDQTLRIWDLENGESLRTLEGHTGEVTAVAVTPDGRRAVSASHDQTLRIWDLESGESLRTLEGHTQWVNTVAVTPDGRRAVSASHDQTLRIWDLESGESLRTLEGHTQWVNTVAVTPDRRRAVSASHDQTLRIWDLENGESLRTLEGHTDWVIAVAVTPDGRRAVSASHDQTLRIWDLESGKSIATFAADSGLACANTPDGLTFVGGDQSGQVHFLRLIEADNTRRPAGATKALVFRRQNFPA